jgi:hypothetical protein
MKTITMLGRLVGAMAVAGLAATATSPGRADDTSRASGGLVVYLGVVPADLIRTYSTAHHERHMHGGPPRGANHYHVMISIFDEATGTRVHDAQVEAEVAGLDHAGIRKPLEPMAIAGTVTYGNYFYMIGHDRYRIRVQIRRPGVPGEVETSFNHAHHLR